MSGFLYYLPESKDGAARAWLKDRFDAAAETRVTEQGPDGQPGVCCCLDNDRKPRLGYYPETQRWRRFPSFWIGVETAAVPGPADLIRPSPFHGVDVPLGDGNRWRIPVARLLPRQLGLSESGELTLLPMTRFLWITEQAELVWQAVTSADRDGNVSLTVADEWRLANEVLALNYYAGPEEASTLGLFDTHNMSAVLLALVDWEAFRKTLADLAEADQKKSPAAASVTASIASGAKAGDRTTCPPSPISSSRPEDTDPKP